ncbi:MAG TPA: hypothetical protein VJQ56_03780 [Blastocatellia bacterium]|nr:hypothetical protein [Blastocatellia bacterium]
MKQTTIAKMTRAAAVVAMLLVALTASAEAQSRRGGDKLVDIKVGELTLESIDLRDQTARLSIGLDITNRLIPVSLKDFDYRLSLYGLETIEGNYDGTMKIGGKDGGRINLPVVVRLRSIPSVIWTAFTSGGRVQYDLDTAFTLPLLIFEKRFDKSFSGEVPLKSLVDAASILRARRLSDIGIIRR